MADLLSVQLGKVLSNFKFRSLYVLKSCLQRKCEKLERYFISACGRKQASCRWKRICSWKATKKKYFQQIRQINLSIPFGCTLCVFRVCLLTNTKLAIVCFARNWSKHIVWEKSDYIHFAESFAIPRNKFRKSSNLIII